MSRKPAHLADAFLGETELSLELAANILLEPRPASPSAPLRARLLGSLASTHRFDDLESDVARILDLPTHAAASLLLAIDEKHVWQDGPLPGVSTFHVDGGPKVKNAITGFVRMAPGVPFPEHEHMGDETVLVLQGSFEDHEGAVRHAGAELHMPAGSHHSFRAIGEVRLLYLAVIQNGLKVDGTTILPGDPRA